MKKSTRKQIEALETMRLPELWARFAEVTGKETKAPNRKYLVRAITEALEAGDAAEKADAEPAPPEAPEPTAPEASEPTAPEASEPTADEAHEATPADETGADADDAQAEVKLTKLGVEELQRIYVEVVGRPTGSSAKAYLVWKIRQAQKGRIPVGPRRTRRADGEAADFKVLPLRMEAELVTQLDEARERLGLKNRMELFRRALHAFLLEAGEVRVAEMFAPPEA